VDFSGRCSRNGLVLLQGAPGCRPVAEDHFLQAIEWARHQRALSWELRAAMSLARLWDDQGQKELARGLLVPVYERFTEGFATTDLEAARALIGGLR